MMRIFMAVALAAAHASGAPDKKSPAKREASALANAAHSSRFDPEAFELTSGELRAAVAAVSAAAKTPAQPPPKLELPSFESDSPVFRMRSKSAEHRDVEVEVELRDRGLRSGVFAGKNAWDGVHLWLRYQNPAHLYAISVNRRDDRIVIKKKIPGGPSNGGTYFDLCPTVPYQVPYGDWQKVSASATTNGDGSVTLRLKVNGKVVMEALDDGSEGGAPIAGPGRVGLRADNADFEFRGFTVRRL